MKTSLAQRGAIIALASLGLAAPALAQDKTAKIGVLNDMSSLYADIGGPNSIVAGKSICSPAITRTSRTLASISRGNGWMSKRST
jgi:hypothetical protein